MFLVKMHRANTWKVIAADTSPKPSFIGGLRHHFTTTIFTFPWTYMIKIHIFLSLPFFWGGRGWWSADSCQCSEWWVCELVQSEGLFCVFTYMKWDFVPDACRMQDHVSLDLPLCHEHASIPWVRIRCCSHLNHPLLIFNIGLFNWSPSS